MLLYLQSDLLITELVDEDGNAVKEGEVGELVITTLGIEGMPLIRFKTGDMCIAHEESCSCGRESLRLGPVVGRKKQMIKYKGTSLYPNAIYDILENIDAVKNYQVEVTTNSSGTDDIQIHLGMKENLSKKEEEIINTFRAKLRVAPRLNFLSPEEVNTLLQPKNSRKPLKFIDKREHNTLL